jgi:hypothetical protein
MDLSELINKLSTVSISTTDEIIHSIINYLYESSEAGKNSYTYYFDTSTNIKLIIENLQTYFPDLVIHYSPNTYYIVLDWS